MNITRISQAERKLYERLTIFRDDLYQAAYFAGYLAKRGWHFDPWDRRIRWPTYMQQAAFTSALVVAYCRPFAKSRSAPTLPMKLAPYRPNELALHEKLKALRNSVYAHSDVELQRVRPTRISGRASAIVSMPILKLTREETELVLCMIGKTVRSIGEKLQSLIARVESEA